MGVSFFLHNLGKVVGVLLMRVEVEWRLESSMELDLEQSVRKFRNDAMVDVSVSERKRLRKDCPK
jgi:hypothetical protein